MHSVRSLVLGGLMCVLLGAYCAPGWAQTVYRCQEGERTVYQQEPCDRPGQGGPIEDRITVIEAHPGRSAAPASRGGAEPAQCSELRSQARRIEAQMRNRSSETLERQLRTTRQKLSELRCGARDPR